MNRERIPADDDLSQLLDGLVCGELEETDRGRLHEWLEADPFRWRQCGLAFLEAQTWSQALEQFPRGRSDHEMPRRADRNSVTATPADRTRRQKRVRAALAAVAVLAAFCLGLALRRPGGASHGLVVPQVTGDRSSPADAAASQTNLPDSAGAGGPVLAAFDMQAGGQFGAHTPIRIPVVPTLADKAHDGAARQPAEIPAYVRQQWERRGYKVSLERRYVFARLPDGQQVVVPVEKFHVNPLPININ